MNSECNNWDAFPMHIYSLNVHIYNDANTIEKYILLEKEYEHHKKMLLFRLVLQTSLGIIILVKLF